MNNTTLPKGFKAFGMSCGIKKDNIKDLGLIYSEKPANAAGVFTKNVIKAAPVLLCIERIKTGKFRAAVANSGNANCCVGPTGMESALRMTRAAAKALDIDETSVYTASTGVIGAPLPVSKIENAAEMLVKGLSENGMDSFAESIMTTDTVPKTVTRTAKSGYTITGTAKGAGMIRPDMATMLSFIVTDAGAISEYLYKALKKAADITMNIITIDGDTSTNDTVLIAANGESGFDITTGEDEKEFESILESIMFDLSKMMLEDGEGVTKIVTIAVKGASNDEDAAKIADTIAHSPLVKTAFFGEDANWGRIIAATGRAGAAFNPETVDILFDDVIVAENSVARAGNMEEAASAVLKKPEFTVTVNLNIGQGTARMLTTDFSYDYIKINADYRS